MAQPRARSPSPQSSLPPSDLTSFSSFTVSIDVDSKVGVDSLDWTNKEGAMAWQEGNACSKHSKCVGSQLQRNVASVAHGSHLGHEKSSRIVEPAG